MPKRFVILVLASVGATACSSLAAAQAGQPQQQTMKAMPAPSRDLSGTWTPGPNAAIQAGGVAAMPNDGKPEHQLPYTPYGSQVYKSHKPLEGPDAVKPALFNDPRDECEPLGFPRMNHYNLRHTQIFQDQYKIAILYEYDRRYRTVWIDGRELPTILDGGVRLGKGWGADSGHVREPRFYGYSVGRWVDDNTLVIETVGTMPEDRVWLDSTGRPISDKIKVTETIHRIDRDHLEWTELIDDPKIYTKPWVTMDKIRMTLADPQADIVESYCSPAEMKKYYEEYGNAVSDLDDKK